MDAYPFAFGLAFGRFEIGTVDSMDFIFFDEAWANSRECQKYGIKNCLEDFCCLTKNLLPDLAHFTECLNSDQAAENHQFDCILYGVA